MTVSGLKPARRYQFRLYAENVIGEGDPSDSMPVIPIEMPQQRMSLILKKMNSSLLGMKLLNCFEIFKKKYFD